MDGNNFHSTVLQRPRSQPDREDERDRQTHRHDTLTSGSAREAPQPPGSSHRHSESSFRVRSPSGGASDYNQHSSSHYASPTGSHHRHSLHLQSPPRAPALHSPVNHYMAPAKSQGSPGSGGPAAPALPPVAGLAPPQTAGPSSIGGASHHHHHPSASPLHPPPAYFPPPSDHHPRDGHSSTGSKRRFYDPTTDNERRVSDSWQDTTPKVSKPAIINIHNPHWGAGSNPRQGRNFFALLRVVKHHTRP